MFCDPSVPPGGKGFSVYEDMRDTLVAQGIPCAEIEFIQDNDSDPAKPQLFRNVRAGKVRILFRSTRKMGTGANVQERSIALHHFDAPWRTADVEQREGRILRQGTQNPEVQIHRYVTERPFDAFGWHVLSSKPRAYSRCARVLGTTRRVVVSLANAAVKRARQKNPKTNCNTRSCQKRFRCARGGRERLHALVFAKSSALFGLHD